MLDAFSKFPAFSNYQQLALPGCYIAIDVLQLV
jgi:hypothetical protein